MTKLSKIIYLWVTFVFFILIDVFFSELVINNGYKFPQNDIVDFINIQNNGAAFNIFEGSKWFLILFAIFALIGIIFYVLKHIDKISGIAVFLTSMLCSGIFTNMAERLIFGHVRDYIKLNFIDFPIFNISDVFINLSVFVIVIIILKNKYLKNNNENNN